MKNFTASASRFLKNKNTVTIIGVILILVLLYIGYSYQINQAVQPQSVPVATETIQPRTEITSDMVQMIDMPNVSLSDNVITSSAMVIGKYSNINTVIPEGSMFYTDTVVDESELPDSVFINLKAGEIAYNFPVDMESTYGNSIFPGNKIDIFMKVGNGTDQKIMVGKLIENVEVLAVKDSSGAAVFENTNEGRSPAMLIFGLPGDLYSLLRKASYMSNLGVELYPVPHGGEVDTSGGVQATTEQLIEYINAYSVDIPITSNSGTDTLLPTISADADDPYQITITFPSGCGSTYTCTYSQNGGSNVTVTTQTQALTFEDNGTLTATVTEASGTPHTVTTNIPLPNSTTNEG